MDFWIQIILIITALIFFCLFLRWVIIEWKNRLLFGGYFKQNADLLRETARQQSRARREAERNRRANLAPRNLFVHIPPPDFEVAVKMSPVFYIDVEDPPSYADAINFQSTKIPAATSICTECKNSDKIMHSDGVILNVHSSINVEREQSSCSTSQSDYSTNMK